MKKEFWAGIIAGLLYSAFSIVTLFIGFKGENPEFAVVGIFMIVGFAVYVFITSSLRQQFTAIPAVRDGIKRLTPNITRSGFEQTFIKTVVLMLVLSLAILAYANG